MDQSFNTEKIRNNKNLHHVHAIKKEKWVEEWPLRFEKVKTRCSRCLYDDQTPAITFDAEGICNYCRLHEKLDREYPAGDAGYKMLKQIAENIKKDGRKNQYDVIVGVSGGCDSSYMVFVAKQLGLRPLAVHFDNTWDSQIAVENIHNVLKKLDVELYTYVVDNEEFDDMYRAFFRSGVTDFDIQTDIGLATTLYRAAEKFNVKYIFVGHSFRTEGLSPIGWVYMDAKYIDSIQKQYGTMPLKTFPNLWLSSQLKWMIFNKIKQIRPLWYINHNKEETKQFLVKECGWQWYGGHHLENRLSSFGHTYFHPRRNNTDQRLSGYSALIRSGQMSREEGLSHIQKAPDFDPALLEMMKKRLGITDDEFEYYMTMPKKTFRDFKTYKHLFERYRPFFWLMAKMDLIPMSFYIKYTSRKDI